MQQKKIVVLEGNGEAAAAISSELRNAGFEVCAVSDDGEKAEELVKEYDPDAMLVGMTLKNVDGFGVLDKLREMHARCAVLASGNFSDDATTDLILQKGARYYMMRPVNASQVAARLGEIFAEPDARTSVVGNDRK